MQTDEQLMVAFQQGDQAAFEQLVDRWYTRAIAYVVSIIHQPSQAEDIVQDCFALLLLKHGQYDAKLSFGPFFKTLLYHKCIDHVRKQKNKAILISEDVPIDPRSPEFLFIQSVFYDSLLMAISNMPPLHRKILIAFALDGQSYQEIAHTCHRSVPQIKILLYRIRKQLKALKED